MTENTYTCPRCKMGGIAAGELERMKHPGESPILRYCPRCAFGVIQIAQSRADLAGRAAMTPVQEILPGLITKTPSLRDLITENLKKFTLTDTQFLVAQKIYEASEVNDRYVSIAEISAATRLSDRDVKAVVRELRREYFIPIIARRSVPFGYRVARTAAEFEAWEKPFMGQVRDELKTFYQLKRRNWPKLTGQGKIEFDLDAE